MFFDQPLLVAVAVAFGGWLGWAMAGRPSERLPAVTSLAIALLIGVVTLLIGGSDPATRAGQAGISLTVGGAVALAAYFSRSRWGTAAE